MRGALATCLAMGLSRLRIASSSSVMPQPPSDEPKDTTPASWSRVRPSLRPAPFRARGVAVTDDAASAAAVAWSVLTCGSCRVTRRVELEIATGSGEDLLQRGAQGVRIHGEPRHGGDRHEAGPGAADARVLWFAIEALADGAHQLLDCAVVLHHHRLAGNGGAGHCAQPIEGVLHRVAAARHPIGDGERGVDVVVATQVTQRDAGDVPVHVERQRPRGQ